MPSYHPPYARRVEEPLRKSADKACDCLPFAVFTETLDPSQTAGQAWRSRPARPQRSTHIECGQLSGADRYSLQYQPPITSFELMMDPKQLGQQHPHVKKNNSHDSQFRQNLIDAGIYPPYHHSNVPKPDNCDDIHDRLAQPRPSLSPAHFTPAQHAKFVQMNARAYSESQVEVAIISVIEGQPREAQSAAGNHPFHNLNPFPNADLPSAVPGRYYGARSEQLDRQVRQKLRGDIIPTRTGDRPILPNFFLEVKHPDQSASVAQNQAMHDGALGERGMRSLESFGHDKPASNNAHTMPSTYHDGTLKLYATHAPLTGPDWRPEYHMNQLRSFAMTDSPQTFQEGATAYRNARDLAEDWRNAFIRQANEQVQERKVD
jgi:hypothetical protein